MPFTESGMTPDIIVNPNAFPKRMTIGQLIECVYSKMSVLKGHHSDGTPFTRVDIDSIIAELKELGYEEHGFEVMYNGMTGKKFLAKIFIGPTYYLRLKHLVADKYHCLSLDHEVLTEKGWKKYPDITYEDKIATLKDGKTVYEKPTELIHYPSYKGAMYHVNAPDIDLNVTEEHRMYVSVDNKPFELIKVKDLVGKVVKYKTKGKDILVNHATNMKIKNVTEEVFCLQVPSEVFYVRRNDKEIWTGNSRARGPKQSLVRQPPEGSSSKQHAELSECKV
jgi:hypothetical protein